MVAIEDKDHVVAAVDNDGTVADFAVGNSGAVVALAMLDGEWLGVGVGLSFW